MKYLIIIFLIFSGICMADVAWGIDCNKHKVFCKIKELRPDIDTEFALALSNTIYKKAKKFGIDPMISVAIAMQESSLRNINRESYGVIKNCTNPEAVDTMDCKPRKVITDIGIFQINTASVFHYDLDIEKLLTEIDYQVMAHFKILKDKMKICAHLDNEAWTCYHSTTTKHRLEYLKLVKRYL